MKFLLVSCLLLLLILPQTVQARRITPEDIVDAKRVEYEAAVKNYSPSHQTQIRQLNDTIAEVNTQRSDQLVKVIQTQGAILDEYERRSGGKNADGIKDARYWLTFAHEAVAYQKAKVYIFNLTHESSIKLDLLSTISVFQSDLTYARSQVIKSQKIIASLIKNE